MVHRFSRFIYYLLLALIILSILSCTLSYRGDPILGENQSEQESTEVPGDDISESGPIGGISEQIPDSELSIQEYFGELASVSGPPLSIPVDANTNSVTFYDGINIHIPAGAFPEANQLQADRIDVAFNTIAPDVSWGVFYEISTEKDVPSLGSPIILEFLGLSGYVTVVHYEEGKWVTVPQEPGGKVQVSIDHFSRGVWGIVEWHEEQKVRLAEEANIDSPNDRMRAYIEKGDENVKSFFGVNEKSNKTYKEMCDEILAVLQKYNNPDGRKFPQDVDGWSYELADYLYAGNNPSQVGGPFWKATEKSMDEIDNVLFASKKQNSPAEVLEIAIEANNGNVPLGILAAHNYLKEVTYKGRRAYSPKTGMPWEYGSTAARLSSWRQQTNITAAGEYDKMGPIYHIFAAMTGGLWLPTSASGPAIAHAEAFLRTCRIGADYPDTSKAAADQCGIDAAKWLRDNPAEPKKGIITLVGQLYPAGFGTAKTVTKNYIAITYHDGGEGGVGGEAAYAGIYLKNSGIPGQCDKDLPYSLRWEIFGEYNPVTKKFKGTARQYTAGQLIYDNCTVGTVEEMFDRDAIWEAELNDGIVTGSIYQLRSDGSPNKMADFELR